MTDVGYNSSSEAYSINKGIFFKLTFKNTHAFLVFFKYPLLFIIKKFKKQIELNCDATLKPFPLF